MKANVPPPPPPLLPPDGTDGGPERRRLPLRLFPPENVNDRGCWKGGGVVQGGVLERGVRKSGSIYMYVNEVELCVP